MQLERKIVQAYETGHQMSVTTLLCNINVLYNDEFISINCIYLTLLKNAVMINSFNNLTLNVLIEKHVKNLFSLNFIRKEIFKHVYHQFEFFMLISSSLNYV